MAECGAITIASVGVLRCTRQEGHSGPHQCVVEPHIGDVRHYLFTWEEDERG